MPTASARDVEKAFRSASGAISVCVLHGDNDDIKSDLFRTICRLVEIQPDDPFRFARLEGDSLDLESGRLADEIGAISMFGGSRLIHVRTTARLAEHALSQALTAPVGDWLLVLECPALADADWFATIEREARVLSIACGDENAGDFRSFVHGEFVKASLAPDAAAVERLIALVGDDRASVRGEIAKLSAFLAPSVDVSARHVEEVVADASSMLADELAAAAFDGDCDALARALDRMAVTGADPVQALGAAHRLALNMHKARVKQWTVRGDKHAPAWSAADVRSLVRSLGSAVNQTRRDSASATLSAERTLTALGHTARSRRR